MSRTGEWTNKRFGRRFAAMLTGSAVAALLGQAALARSGVEAIDHGVVLDHVTVVDTRNGTLARDMAVVIDGDRIASVRPAAGVSVVGSAKLINARGKYVVPGYLDMHAHPLNPGSTATDLSMMLSLGITGFRQMSGSPELLAHRTAGTLMPAGAPTLVATSGTILIGQAFAAPEAAVAEVRRQKAGGADFIKAIDLPPATLFAVHAEAKALGLTVTGHLSPLVDVRQAAAMGMDGIEHLGSRESVLLGCSSDEVALRADPPSAGMRGSAGSLASQAGPGGPPANLMALALVNPIVITPPAAFTRYARVLDSYDARRQSHSRARLGHDRIRVARRLSKVLQWGSDAHPRHLETPEPMWLR